MSDLRGGRRSGLRARGCRAGRGQRLGFRLDLIGIFAVRIVLRRNRRVRFRHERRFEKRRFRDRLRRESETEKRRPLPVFDDQDGSAILIQDETKIAAIHLEMQQVIGAEQLRVKCWSDARRHTWLRFGNLARMIGERSIFTAAPLAKTFASDGQFSRRAGTASGRAREDRLPAPI